MLRIWLLGTFWLMLEYPAYMHERVFWLHPSQLSCDHQELACIPNGQHRRVDMKDMNCRNIYGQIDWLIDKKCQHLLFYTFSLCWSNVIITICSIVTGKSPPPLSAPFRQTGGKWTISWSPNVKNNSIETLNQMVRMLKSIFIIIYDSNWFILDHIGFN